MSRTLRFSVFAAGALITLAATAQPAEASRRHRCGRADADIDSLDASLRHTRGGWQLRVEYEIDIEDACRREHFSLLLRVTERGRPVVDRSGRPIVFEIPLDRPTDINDDELEFEHSVTLTLPDGSVYDPKKLRLEAKVIRAHDGQVLDRGRESIDFDRGFRPPRRSQPRHTWRPRRRTAIDWRLTIRG
jgi:hypothetical protein